MSQAFITFVSENLKATWKMSSEDQIFENLLLRSKIAKLENKLIDAELKDKQKSKKIISLEIQNSKLKVQLANQRGYRLKNKDEKDRVQKHDKIRLKYGLAPKSTENEHQSPQSCKKSFFTRLFYWE